MPENNQASDKTKPEATGSSSTQPGSQAIDMNHTNVIVPHRISNHDKLVQTMVMVDGEWVNVNDTNDQKNVQEDMHKVNRVVTEAQKDIINAQNAADSAVKSADSAISASKVNSDAIAAQGEAISEAKIALDSATAEIQQTAANAASDAAKIRADVARVQNEVDTAKAANSASVEALKSDIGTTKQDLANVHDSLTKAQSAVEQNQKLINDSVAKISNDITQDRKDLATAQQNNADLAKQLDDYSKQAEAQGKTIKSIQDKQDSFTATLADVQGNVSQVSDKVDGLSASLKDAQGNVATVKAQADQLNATLTDHAKSIATLTASAKELSSTLEDADGRLNKVEQTAQTNSSTLSDVQGDLSQVKQQADGLVSTLKDAQGNIDQLQQAAKGTAEQISDVQGDITNLQKDVNGIKLTIADHDKNIHTLQADSKSLQDDMADAKGNISSLQKTSTDLTSEVQDHSGRLSKVEQTASTLTNELSDEQGHLNRVEQTAQGTQQTVANQQGQINTIKTDAAGIHETLTGQGNQIANINVTLNGLNTKYEGVSGDLGKLKSSTMQNRGTVNAPDFNTLTQAGYYTVTHPISGKNYPIGNWGTLEVSGQTVDGNGRLNQKYVGDNDGGTYTRQYNANTKSWTAWIKTANQNDVTALSNRITTNSTQITQNKQAIALKADQSTVNNLSGEVSQTQAQLKVQAGQISSKVSSSDFKTLDNKVSGAIARINENATAIDQTNQKISLKADQTEVDKVKQTATQNSSRLNVMANEISSKVTSTDVNNIINGKGYATTSTVQSLITQKAGTINESIANLTSKVNSNVTQVQSLTASIDGLQSTVANKADKSQVTQLSNLVQSKVSSTDFNNLRKAVDLQTLESADANNLKTNGHYFVHNLANNPVGGWVYVDVTGNGNDRIRQDVYQDDGNKHKYRRWFGNSWTNWSEGATESEITQLRDDINLRVKSGDLLSQINIEAGRTLIQSNKIYFDADSFVMSPNSKAFIPSAFITNLSADKITTGTLDASKLHVKNFSANDIEAGTLSGVTIKAGDDTDFFQTSQDNIYWITNNGRQSALIGRGAYVTFPGLNIFDSHDIHLGTWAGAHLENGTIKDIGGSLGHPKFNIERPGDSAFDLLSKYGEMGSTMVPLDNSRISGWVDQHEFFYLKQTQGFYTELNPDLNTSQFRIQKNDHIGAYFGEGNNGNQITFNFGGNDSGLNVNGPLHVTGSKNSIVETRQGYLAINAYETAEYYFGDIGENNTGDTSQVVIGIDRIFNEVVNTDIQYQVFVTPYSNAHVWVEKRYNNRFIVKSDRPNAEFGWELKAKRKGYESNRLRRVNVDFNQMDLKGEN